MKGQNISDRLLDFAVRIGKVVDALPESRLGRHVAGQLIRCGTSPAPNYEEARVAESRADFVHKLKIALKELRESRLWLRLIAKSDMLPDHLLGELTDECDQLTNTIASSIVTTKKNARPPS
jgi:four helix bundle protein